MLKKLLIAAVVLFVAVKVVRWYKAKNTSIHQDGTQVIADQYRL